MSAAREHITHDNFRATFPHLVEGRLLLPKKPSQRRMLLLSTVLRLNAHQSYLENQINAELQHWISQFGSKLSIDHVTLRRYLVDELILCRDDAGTSYELCRDNARFTFDASIQQLDLPQLLDDARKARARKKARYSIDE